MERTIPFSCLYCTKLVRITGIDPDLHTECWGRPNLVETSQHIIETVVKPGSGPGYGFPHESCEGRSGTTRHPRLEFEQFCAALSLCRTAIRYACVPLTGNRTPLVHFDMSQPSRNEGMNSSTLEEGTSEWVCLPTSVVMKAFLVGTGRASVPAHGVHKAEFNLLDLTTNDGPSFFVRKGVCG